MHPRGCFFVGIFCFWQHYILVDRKIIKSRARAQKLNGGNFMELKVCPNCNSKRINPVVMSTAGYETSSYYCMDCGKEFAFKIKSSVVEEIYSDIDGDLVFFKFKKPKQRSIKKRVLLAR